MKHTSKFLRLRYKNLSVCKFKNNYVIVIFHFIVFKEIYLHLLWNVVIKCTVRVGWYVTITANT